ncbi:hypothetical protein, conserved [Leishmania tarentolae]|uniref:Uncharacterized protein n=1 Tax=Leishmania tarentolae TaxID=5689 RepID=A0A640KH31_LEITA|nr:hypothetical protein, conserved [Leishmania tarentolae]
MPAPSGLTVAEQVAALPPLSQLLGLDPPETRNHETNATRKVPARLASSRTGASRATKAFSSKALPAVTPQGPLIRAPEVEVPALHSLVTKTNSAVPVSSCSAHRGSDGLVDPPTPVEDERTRSSRDWHRVRKSLQLPIAYRCEEDVLLSLRLLRSLPLFAPLLDDDLLTLAETMTMMEVKGAGKVLLRKDAADDAGHLSSSAGAGAAAMERMADDRRSLSQEALLVPPNQEKDEEQTNPQEVWTMPAEHLFRCFREQMSRGEPPSLPPECTENRVGPNLDGSRPSMTAKRTAAGGSRGSQGRPTNELTELRTSSITMAPLFSPDDEATTEDRAFSLVLLSGHCRLEWPRERNLMEDAAATSLWQSYELQPGDAIGYGLIWGALPPAAQYVTCETSTLLVVNSEGRLPEVAARLRRVCNRADEAMFRAQRRFLAHRLHVRLFDPDNNGPGARHTASASVGERLQEHGLPDGVGVTAAEAPAPSVASLLDQAARSLIPIRVPTHTVLFREGLTPVQECAIYFLVDGGLAVVRRIWSQDQQRLLSERMQLVRELTPTTGFCPPMTSLPATDSMEVTQLRQGDYCGEVAYLNEDPDHVPSIDAEWTEAYWKSTLAQPIGGSSRGGRCGDTDGQCSHGVADWSSGRDARNSLFRRHKSTVVAQQASSLYVLLPHAAHEVVVGVVEQRMRDHVHRAYLGYSHVFAQYEKLYKWALHKERVMFDVSLKAPVNFR